jgi:hypothetical protein
MCGTKVKASDNQSKDVGSKEIFSKPLSKPQEPVSQVTYNVPAIVIGTMMLLIGIFLIYDGWQHYSLLTSSIGDRIGYMLSGANVAQSEQNYSYEMTGGLIIGVLGFFALLFYKNR